MGVLNLDFGGVTGGRSVWGAEGGDGGPRGLRVGIRGSSDGSPRKLKLWGSRRQSRGEPRGSGREGVRGVRLRVKGPRGLQRRGAREEKSEGSLEWGGYKETENGCV